MSPVAITGTGVVCAVGDNVESFTEALRCGRTGISSPAEAGSLTPAAALIDSRFDAAQAISDRAGLPAELRRLACRIVARAPSPVQMSAAVALEAWEAADLAARPVPADRVSIVVAGSNLTGRHAQSLYPKFLANRSYLPPRFGLQMLDTDLVGTLSQILGITGEGFTLAAASASGNAATIAGGRLVAGGHTDVCVVVGPPAELSDMELQGLANVGAMATGAAGWPFDASHTGFVRGQGAGCLILESAASARARGMDPVALLSGCSQRLSANSLADPCEETEVAVMAEAIARAGLTADDVSYVNAHGSGSPLGDQVEARALTRVFTGARPWVNSTKGLVGHCLSAAGVVEGVATVAQLRGGFVHPNVGLTEPVALTARLPDRTVEPARVEHALSNSFGFGGFHSCVAFSRKDSR